MHLWSCAAGAVLLSQWHENRDTWFRPNLAGDVALTRDVFSNENVPGSETPYGTVAHLDIHGSRHRKDTDTARGIMPGIGTLRIEAADHYTALGMEHGVLGLIFPRLKCRGHVLEV
jgi:hypothetical protein